MRAESQYVQPDSQPEPVQVILQSPQPVERRKSIQLLQNDDNDGQQSPTARTSIDSPQLHKIVENPIGVIETSQLLDVTDNGIKKPSPTQRRSPPPPVPQKSKDTRVTSVTSSTTAASEPEPHVEADCTVNNKRRSGECN